MRHRLFVDAVAEQIEITGEEFHHAARVVRARVGEEVEVFDGKGAAARGVVESIDRDRLTVRVSAPIEAREQRVEIEIALALIQLEKFEMVLQKATELGAASIVPLLTERTEVRRERTAGKMERWQKIVLEATKQSGRAVVPPIAAPIELRPALERDGEKVFFDADTEATPLPESPRRLTLFIGPEGGWTEEEIRLARDSGCSFARLGPRRLRAETAAITAIALCGARYGDLRW